MFINKVEKRLAGTTDISWGTLFILTVSPASSSFFIGQTTKSESATLNEMVKLLYITAFIQS